MPVDRFDVALDLAAFLQDAPADDEICLRLDAALRNVFGHRLFTVLVFDAQRNLLKRLYSNRPDISPVGGAKRVGNSDWARRVLREGQFFVGSTRADIQSTFSEHQVLLKHGCESVLNIPVRVDGATVGTLNLLDHEHNYDNSDLRLARLFAQLMAQPMARMLNKASLEPSADVVIDVV